MPLRNAQAVNTLFLKRLIFETIIRCLMTDFKVQIQDLISQGRLKEAIERAKQASLAGITALDTPATLLSAEYAYLERNAQLGLLTTAEASARRQSIAFRLLDLVNDLGTKPEQKTVLLFLGANPFHKLPLELEREIREVSAGLDRFGKRDVFDFRAKIHVTPTDLQRMLLEGEYAPRLVHFAGNAVVDHPEWGTGVIFEDEQGQAVTVRGDVLALIFRQFPSVECVFLNTCDSGPSALAIGQHVRYVIGMNARIYDESAIIFAVAFYEAIASGKDVPFAFEFARTRLMTSHFAEQASIPVLIVNGQCAEPVYVVGDSHLSEPAQARPIR